MSPWQRGANEKTNWSLRLYYPQETDLVLHSQIALNKIAQQLNQRPRKTLEYETPAERISAWAASIGRNGNTKKTVVWVVNCRTTNQRESVSVEKSELVGIREELATISLALSILAMNQLGAADANERERHELASTKGLDLLLKRLEAL